jgi:hypothetical protein
MQRSRHEWGHQPTELIASKTMVLAVGNVADWVARGRVISCGRNDK